MWLIFDNYAAGRRCQFGLFIIISLLLQKPAMGVGKFEGDACEMKSGKVGVCRLGSQCSVLMIAIKNHEVAAADVVNCGLGEVEEIICCPSDSPAPPSKSPTQSTPTTQPRIQTPLQTTINVTEIDNRKSERPSIEACRRFNQHTSLDFIKHVIRGVPAELGEFPHMAAIGYRTIGNDGGPYDFRCGGTLIEDRFVLTAAHCVNSLSYELRPYIVRLGVVDFKDPEQMKNAVEILVKNVVVHQNFSNSLKIHDIAVLELESPCVFTDLIRPTCLYTNIMDPPKDSKLIVTGWGYASTTTKTTSDILLQAELEIEDLKTCRAQYLNEKIVLNSGHLCAIDRKLKQDACQADSGGPLSLVVNQNQKIYNVIGVVSAGFSCATAVPGLYARVANYLDFIENIVWPRK